MKLKGSIINVAVLAIFALCLATCSSANQDDAGLSSLTISQGTLTPSFEKDTLTYSVQIPITTYSVTFVATAVAGDNALITINGLPATSGNESGAIVLYAGSNTIEIVVKAPNREIERTYTISATKSISELESILRGSDTGVSDNFGWSLACDGTTLVVGAPRALNGTDRTGAVYVFNKTSSTWTQTAKLLASDGADGDSFGWSVALYGTTIAVGAPNRDHDGTDVNSGAVYIFTKSGSTWTEQAIKESSDPCFEYYFGWSVSLADGTLAVGEPDSALSSTSCSHGPSGGGYYGAVHIFTGSGSSWTHRVKIQASNANSNNYFGEAISLYGATLAVGARGYSSNRGTVYIFTGSVASWTEQAQVSAVSPTTNSNFGASVSLYGTRLVVGAPNESTSETNSGAVYLYSGSGSSWTSAGSTIKAETPVENDYFGNSVNLYGDIFAVGAPGNPSETYIEGSTTVFGKKEFFVWGQVGDPLIPTETEAAQARFGQSVAATDTEIFIGASNYNLEGSGAVYVYH